MAQRSCVGADTPNVRWGRRKAAAARERALVRRRLRLLALTAAILAALAAGVAWAAESITLGQTGSDTPCDTPSDFVAVQTGTSGDVSYTVPPGRWRLISWKAAGSPTGGKEALVVFRPTGAPDEYKVVASTRAKALSKPTNKLTGLDIKVRGGDLIGFWAEAGTTCALFTGNANDTASVYFPSEIPDAGTTMTLMPGLAVGFRLNMQVTLSLSRSNLEKNPLRGFTSSPKLRQSSQRDLRTE